jgi:hypothetical protein
LVNKHHFILNVLLICFIRDYNDPQLFFQSK